MVANVLGASAKPKEQCRKEGELYKVLTAHGVTFELYYGYYEEIDRLNPDVGPMEMYPNFVQNPVYTKQGIPFVTAMQKSCKHFKGESEADNTCYQCEHYEKCEELLGICKCKAMRKNE